jgi:serine/threonine protein kinase
VPLKLLFKSYGIGLFGDGCTSVAMKKLGKFEIIEKVGQGAMGVVYKARDPFIDRIVALKTLTTGLADDANLLKRFYSEARSAGGLQHPNIVTIYELGHEGDTPFIAMQFLTGDSLDKILDRRPNLPLSQKIGFIVYVCRALEYAHKQNPPVVHRDIKPGNVMVTVDGAVVVVDFGIARLGEGTRSQSAGMLIGTLGYMSPQLFRNGAADARSDIWATGVMFYELLAFRRPFEGDNAAALMSNIILEKPRSLDESAPDTPADLQAVVDRMLAKDAEARYQSMEEVLMELEPIWRRVQQADVSDLLANTQQLFEAGKLDRAKSNISQIIQMDPSNTVAKSWSEKINAELKRKEIGPRLSQIVERAQRLLADGKVDDAQAEVQAALKLDSTYQPAKEVLGQVQSAIDRDRKIAVDLRNSKQRMAEGALTEAELLLDKVLALDPGNAAARDQLKQIREERSRRERRKQRDEALHRARTLWTNLQYEECIALLLAAQKQFPGDSEITKLLESARQDQAEQQRQSLLTEARNLLSAQRFDDSLQALDRLLERYPSDATAKNLRTHALQGQEQQMRDQRLAEGKLKLRAWVKEEKYSEAISHAGQLSKEFPEDFELRELVEFARAELSQIEQKRRFEQYSKQIQLAMKDGRFSAAIKSAEKALVEFPKNLDLLIFLDRAKKEQGEKEKHELLKQRLREVERMVERQELTDAIDLARQTLATVGQDPRIADTLIKAEREVEFREQKKRQQSEALLQARTLFNSGKFTDATATLQQAVDTQLFPANDPQIAKLQKEIAAKKEPPASPTAAAAMAGSGGAPSATLLIPPGPSTPSVDAGKDYVYQRGTPLPAELLSPERDAVASSFSPTTIGPSTQPSTPPVPQVILPEPRKKPEPAPAPVDSSATQMFSPAASTGEAASEIFAPEVEVEQPAVDKRAPRKPATQKTVEPSPQPIPQPFWKNPMALGGAALTLVMGTIATAYLLRPKPAITQPTPENHGQTESPTLVPPIDSNPGNSANPSTLTARDFYNQAEGYYKRGDSLRAKAVFEKVTQDSDADASLRKNAQSYLEELTWLRDAGATLNRDPRKARALFQKVADLNLGHAGEARNSIQQIDSGNKESLYRAQIFGDLQNHDYLGAKQKLNEFTGGHDSNGELARQIEDSENQWFGALQNQFEQAKGASNVDQLQSLRPELERIVSGGGSNASRAKSIVESGIPNAINEINKRKQDAAWNQIVADYRTALDGKNRNALISLKDQLQPFLSGQHIAEAQQYIVRINEILNSAPPPPQPPTIAGSTSSVTEQDKIERLLDAYKQAFEGKDQALLRHVWPTPTDKKYKETLEAIKLAQSIRITLTRNTPIINGNEASIDCLQIMEIKTSGQVQPIRQNLTFHLRKLGGAGGGDWIIDHINDQKTAR